MFSETSANGIKELLVLDMLLVVRIAVGRGVETLLWGHAKVTEGCTYPHHSIAAHLLHLRLRAGKGVGVHYRFGGGWGLHHSWWWWRGCGKWV